MINLETKLANMQAEIDKMVSGYCVLVKLMNYDELCAIIGAAQTIICDLSKIVRGIATDYGASIFVQIEYNKVFVILPNIDDVLLKKFAAEIYSASQLYVNENLPAAYMNCRVATIRFPNHSKRAVEMHGLLIGMLANFKSHDYHYEYCLHFYDLNIIKGSNEQLNLLRKSLSLESRKFAYQPIIDRKTGYIYYYECLLRIPDQNNNLISIGPIIKYAENKGLINILDQVVLEMAIKELSVVPHINLSINISNVGVLSNSLLEIAKSLLRRYDVGGRLMIEMTETLLNEDYDRTRSFIERLRKFGCRFALDDFGSGFTSFKQLKNLPIDVIKIDGSYIKNIVNDHHSKYFVEALVRISEEMGVKTVAEFVENGEIAKFLIDLKIDGMQGNFFSPASTTRNK